MQWLALWKKIDRYKNDNSIWSNNYKDFIFVDDGKTDFPEIKMHTPRTPTIGWKSKKLNMQEGCVLHFQFSNWQAFQIKQCWYRCSELIDNKGLNHIEINKKYSITIDKNKFQNKFLYNLYEKLTTSEIPYKFTEDIVMPELDHLYIQNYWRIDQINQWFNEYGSSYFKNLDIWHVDEIQNLINE